MEITETFEPRGPQDFEGWLKENGSKKKQIWAVLYRKATGKQVATYRQLLESALCYGWIDNIEKGMDDERFAIRFAPRRPGSNWSKANRTLARQLLAQGRMTEAGLAALPKDMEKNHV